MPATATIHAAKELSVLYQNQVSTFCATAMRYWTSRFASPQLFGFMTQLIDMLCAPTSLAILRAGMENWLWNWFRSSGE